MKKDVFRENQVNEAAREHEAKGCGRSGFSFGCGVEWADAHPSHETIRRVTMVVARWLHGHPTVTPTWPSADYIEEQMIRKPTQRMTQAVKFCERVLNVQFNGDRESFLDMSSFLHTYLDEAKVLMNDTEDSYYCNFDY